MTAMRGPEALQTMVCSASISGAGNYVPAKSTITPFTYKIPVNWCDKTYEIVGIVNPKPDPMCCRRFLQTELRLQ
ncbi:MAG: hypothetical protein U0T81_14715 [Saprospiraceae bacterium]